MEHCGAIGPRRHFWAVLANFQHFDAISVQPNVGSGQDLTRHRTWRDLSRARPVPTAKVRHVHTPSYVNILYSCSKQFPIVLFRTYSLSRGWVLDPTSGFLTRPDSGCWSDFTFFTTRLWKSDVHSLGNCICSGSFLPNFESSLLLVREKWKFAVTSALRRQFFERLPDVGPGAVFTQLNLRTT